MFKNELSNISHEQKCADKINCKAFHVHIHQWSLALSSQVSPYGWRRFLKKIKEALKDAAKKAAKEGGKQLAKNLKDIARKQFQENKNRTSLYQMEDDVQRPSQFYKSLAEEVDHLGIALEIMGVVGSAVPASWMLTRKKEVFDDMYFKHYINILKL